MLSSAALNRAVRLPLQRAGFTLLLLFTCASPALALQGGGPPCDADWRATFGGFPGVDFATPFGLFADVQGLAVHDDGTGPAVYLTGQFRKAGGVQVDSIARWDGQNWSAVGGGLAAPPAAGSGYPLIRGVLSHDDGSGSKLYVGGNFVEAGGAAIPHVARWDGVSWQPVGDGLDGQVFVLARFDAGDGAELYAGGTFLNSGSVSTRRVARWDGLAWHPLGNGLNGGARTMAVHDRGQGPELFVGGFFTNASGLPVQRLAAWDGSAWSDVGGGLDGLPSALASFDDGSGAALYATGAFSMAGGVPAARIARFDGQSWLPLGSGLAGGLFGTGEALLPLDLGDGPGLYVGGSFAQAGGVPAANLARLVNGTFEPVGGGLDEVVYSLTAFEHGGVTELVAGGAFKGAGTTAAYGVARFDGAQWRPLGSGLGAYPSVPDVRALVRIDDGRGERLYVGGRIHSAGGIQTGLLARFGAAGWEAMPSKLEGSSSFLATESVQTLAVLETAAGPALHAGGTFVTAGGQPAGGVARWDGQQWQTFGPGLGDVRALALFDAGQGPELHAAGNFGQVGDVLVRSIARWDGFAWMPLGAGLYQAKSTIPPILPPFTFDARALAVFDEGAGERLFAGGRFNFAGSQVVSNIARWDGSLWSDVGGGFDQPVDALLVFDDGSGAALFAAGSFHSAGGSAARGVARWNGAAWSAVGALDRDVRTFATADFGFGTRLVAAGWRPWTQELPGESSLLRLDADAWTTLVVGPSGLPHALLADGDGPTLRLLVGGTFLTSPAGDTALAAWGCPPPGDFSLAAGCLGNGSLLEALSGQALAGQGFELQLTAATTETGWGLLFLGEPGWDALGCGQVLAGFGELLLAPVPAPILLGSGPSTAGVTRFVISVPNDPRCVGSHLALQGVHFALLGPDFQVQASNGLTTVVGP